MTIVENKKAYHDYFVEEKFEAGVALEGWEVKAIRAGRAQLKEAYVVVKNREIVLLGADIPAIAAIYAFHVERDTGSFELDAPDAAEMRRRYRDNVAKGYPYLVALSADVRVVGYAYASAYRSRPAYRHTVEDSVYVDAAWSRRGIGRTLLAALIGRCEAGNYRQMVAIIGGAQNAASIALHATLGF